MYTYVHVQSFKNALRISRLIHSKIIDKNHPGLIVYLILFLLVLKNKALNFWISVGILALILDYLYLLFRPSNISLIQNLFGWPRFSVNKPFFQWIPLINWILLNTLISNGSDESPSFRLGMRQFIWVKAGIVKTHHDQG